jgi:hypothetical protein
MSAPFKTFTVQLGFSSWSRPQFVVKTSEKEEGLRLQRQFIEDAIREKMERENAGSASQ